MNLSNTLGHGRYNTGSTANKCIERSKALCGETWNRFNKTCWYALKNDWHDLCMLNDTFYYAHYKLNKNYFDRLKGAPYNIHDDKWQYFWMNLNKSFEYVHAG